MRAAPRTKLIPLVSQGSLSVSLAKVLAPALERTLADGAVQQHLVADALVATQAGAHLAAVSAVG